jgi:DNA-binding NtrC family response regulator
MRTIGPREGQSCSWSFPVSEARALQGGRRAKVLVVDDEPSIRIGLRRALQSKGYEVGEAGSCAEAEAAFAASPPHVAIIDQQLPDGSGVDLLPRLRGVHPGVPVIMLTAHGSIELAVRAIKEGAEQFLTKPVDMQAILVLLERLIEDRRNRQKQLAAQPREGQGPEDPFLGQSDAIRQLREAAERVRDSDRAVLIHGETGSGKGVLARWLHDNGPRRQESFVDLNCASLSRELLDTELFGHEAGAFTSANKTKLGLLDVAHHGTLFLDEIGDMDVFVQPKLLKAIEEHRFRRLGDTRDRHVDTRLITATHQDLGLLIQAGRFREDLYFRISTLPLCVPPLRERPEDIPHIARRLLERFAGELGRGNVPISGPALAELEAYRWPGNIRELRNVLERGLLVGKTAEISTESLQFGISAAPGTGRPKVVPEDALLSLEDVERAHIARVFEAEGRRAERAAARLGISASSLYQRLKKYGISAGRQSPQNENTPKK